MDTFGNWNKCTFLDLYAYENYFHTKKGKKVKGEIEELTVVSDDFSVTNLHAAKVIHE